MDFGPGRLWGFRTQRAPNPYTLAGIGLLSCLSAACFAEPVDLPGTDETEAGTSQTDPSTGVSTTTDGSTTEGSTTTTTGETTGTPSDTTSSPGDSTGPVNTSTGSTSEETSGSSSSGEPVAPGCGDSIVVPTEICYAADLPATGLSYRFGNFEDLDSDGERDLIDSASNGEIVVAFNADGTFGLETTSSFAGVSTLNQMGFTFIDDDNVLDGVLRSEAGGSLYPVLGNTSGAYTIAETNFTEAYALALGNMDDGPRDEAVVLVLGGIEVFSIDPDGSMTRTDALALNDFGEQRDVALADFNEDGQLDVLYLGDYDNGDQVRLVLGNGGGTLNPVPLAPFVDTTDAQDLTTGDLDGDGHIDIAVADGDTLGIIFGNGGLGFAEIPDITVETGTASRIEAADVDLDGIDDLIVGYSDRDALTIYLGNADRMFSTSETVSITQNTETLSVGDINGDAVPDIVVTSESETSLTVIRSTN